MTAMVHKIIHFGEALFIILTISWQPIFGSISAIIASCYYIALFKINVINKSHGGSWKQYLRSLFKK